VRLDKHRDNHKGAVILEGAISIFVFLFVAIIGLQLLIFSYHSAALHYSIAKTARFATLGKGAASPGYRVDDIKAYLINQVRIYGISLDVDDINICVSSPLAIGCTSANEFAGEGLDWVMLRASKPIDYVTFFRPLTLSAQIVMKNEPF
jgi:hypothetical protein